MRWFKHLTSSWDDEKVAAIRAEYGLEIYGFWWRILEIIAKQMDKGPKVKCSYSEKVWASFCGISVKKFKKFSKTLEENDLIISKNCGRGIEIEIPNLVKFRDEYTSRK